MVLILSRPADKSTAMLLREERYDQEFKIEVVKLAQELRRQRLTENLEFLNQKLPEFTT